MGLVIYFKKGQSLLQSGIGIVKWNNFITKSVRYYKVGQLLQKRAVHFRDTGTNGEPYLLTVQM